MNADIDHAVDCLRGGGVVALPTDTQYALAVDAFNEPAVERIFRIKGRPDGMALPVLISSVDALDEVADDVPDVVSELARGYWPGALTLVVRKAASLPSVVTAGGPTVAVRVPDHPVPRAVSQRLGRPITGTSANTTGQPPLNSPADLRLEFGDSLDLVVEGVVKVGRPSTILDVTGEPPRVLREGAIPTVELSEYLGEAIRSPLRSTSEA